MTEPKRIIVQVERPTERTPGAVREGFFRFENGRVYVTDASGRPIGDVEIAEGDNPEAVARGILRRYKAKSGFYGDIPYRRAGIA